jgi:carboxymethylenebutenolidase
MIDMESNTTLVQQFPAHEAVADAPGPLPSVIVLHDVYGLDAHTRAVTNRLAREGFYVLAPNLYAIPFSTAAGAPDWMSSETIRSSFSAEEYEEAKGRAEGLTDEHALRIVRAALAHLALVAEAESSAAGVVGFGMGGRYAFLAACDFPDEIRAAVVFSGEGIAAPYRLRPAEHVPILRFESLRSPVLFFYGAQDDEIRRREREAVERVLTGSSRRHEIVTFREAGHDFFNEESPSYRIAAAREAWEKTLAFLRGGPGEPAA